MALTKYKILQEPKGFEIAQVGFIKSENMTDEIVDQVLKDNPEAFAGYIEPVKVTKEK